MLTDSLRFTAPVSNMPRGQQTPTFFKAYFFIWMHLKQEALLGQMATFKIHSESLKWKRWNILEVYIEGYVIFSADSSQNGSIYVRESRAEKLKYVHFNITSRR